jgi:hypothetical protein
MEAVLPAVNRLRREGGVSREFIREMAEFC